MVNNAFMMYDIKCAGCRCVLHAKVKCMNLTNRDLSCSRKKEARTKRVFTFSGAIPTKSEVQSTTGTKCLDFGGEGDRKLRICRDTKPG